ncbi:histidine phosphatase family protein [Clostridium sp. Marseille-QA1073]
MTTLYITRHGETEWNKLGRMQGWGDSPLTELGIKQAQWFRDRVINLDLNTIYTSSSERAYNTAKIIKGNRDIKIIKNDGLKELKLGLWQGLDKEGIKALDEENCYNYWNNPIMYKPTEGGESFDELKDRIYEAIMKIVNNHKNENILVVSHGMTIKAFLCALQKKSIAHIWDPPFIQQGSLTAIEFNDDNSYKVLMENDISHYKE